MRRELRINKIDKIGTLSVGSHSLFFLKKKVCVGTKQFMCNKCAERELYVCINLAGMDEMAVQVSCCRPVSYFCS